MRGLILLSAQFASRNRVKIADRYVELRKCQHGWRWEEEGKGSKMFTSFMDGPQTKKVVPTPLPIHKLVLKLIESKSISEKGA